MILVPQPVQDLTAHSRNETDISLRFLSPYPPTGRIDFYRIYYDYKYIFVGAKPCEIWKQSRCVEISNLVPNKKYTIKVT